MAEETKFQNSIIGVLALCFGFVCLELLPISLWDLGGFVPFVIVFVILANFDKYISFSIVLICLIVGVAQDLATSSYLGTWPGVNLLTYFMALAFRHYVGIKLRVNIMSAAICVAFHMIAINIVSLIFYRSNGILEAIMPCIVTLLLIRPIGNWFSFMGNDYE